MTTLTLTVTLEPFGERHKAIVHMGEELLSAVVRNNPRSAVIAALEHVAHDVAHELVRAQVAPPGIGLSGNLHILSDGLVAEAFAGREDSP